jgi:hypothetical protein
MIAQDYTHEEIRKVHAVTAGPSEEFRNACEEKWKGTQPPTPPEILYHYTTAQAFREILNSHTIWASDIRYMNDASEVAHASNILKSVIKDKDAMTSVHSDDERKFLEVIANTFDFTEMVRVFALCFSELGDSIPQWIAYAGRRGGLAMGMELKPHLLQSQYATNEGTAVVAGSLVKVVYDDDKLRALSEDLVQHLVKLIVRCEISSRSVCGPS